MDKTPKYQKMCIEVFKDIGYIKPTASSNLMIPAPGSIHNQQADDFMLSFEDKFDDIGLGSTVARPVGQLYQQDQLQNIIGIKDPLDLVERLYQGVYFQYELMSEAEYSGNWLPRREYEQFESMEQLWLAYVMWEKFQKRWDPSKEKWVRRS